MIKRIEHASITVSDLENSIEFYRGVLGMKLLYTTGFSGEEVSKCVGVDNAYQKIAVLKGGQACLELIEYVSPKCESKGLRPCDIGTMHIALEVTQIEKIYEELKSKGIQFIAPPKKIAEGNMKGWIWCYFKDPDGAYLELREYRES